MSVGRCFQCHHVGEVFASGLCLCCEWLRLRDRATDLDTEESWALLDDLNRYVEEMVG